MFSSAKNKKISEQSINLDSTLQLDSLLESIGDSQYVLLGEASHGTHEYYIWRAHISRRLIEEKGFSLIGVEGDWPDCYKINKWIKETEDQNIPVHTILEEFNRWPTWMWANWEIASFATWLKKRNSSLAPDKKIGFYGLDVYSLWESMEIIVEYLKKEDPDTAKTALEASRCFEPFKEKDSYASVFSSALPGCQDEVTQLLKEVRENLHKYQSEEEAGLNAEINSLVMANAERYYKAMVSFGDESWNVRDRHMVETLNTLTRYHGEDTKVIIWEHNTHIGDARATNMAAQGLVNVGQLLREQQEEKGVYLVGFGSHTGSVIAGSNWGAPMKKMRVPHALRGSVEELLHSNGKGNQLLIFKGNTDLETAFSSPLKHRAIGVVYNPERERGNYVPSRMAQRYDAFIYLDKTEALHPLKIEQNGHLTPVTYPFGI